MSKRRVVVTGLGMLSPVGNTAESSWQALLNGQSGISLIDHFDASEFATRFAGLVKEFDPEQYGINRKEARKMDLFIQYGVAAGVADRTRAAAAELLEANPLYPGLQL